jgi:Ca2+-binding EF-hand superfamily protein
MDHNSYWLSRMSLERKSSLGSYIIQYNKVAQNLRIALLELCGDRDISRLELVREIFQAIDGNNSGVITSQEMLSFLRLPELHLFDEDPQNAEKFCELLLEQIDEDGYVPINFFEILFSSFYALI